MQMKEGNEFRNLISCSNNHLLTFSTIIECALLMLQGLKFYEQRIYENDYLNLVQLKSARQLMSLNQVLLFSESRYNCYWVKKQIDVDSTFERCKVKINYKADEFTNPLSEDSKKIDEMWCRYRMKSIKKISDIQKGFPNWHQWQ